MAKPQSLPHARVARRRAVRPGRVMMLGFLAMMLAGAVLLHLPISARGGIMTLGVAVFSRRVSEQKIRYPEGRVMIG